ncbi:unnamed protein product, partial [marine sediment metagenome]
RQALSNLDAILSVKGIDACYIGPADLSISFGLGLPKWDNPEYMKAFDQVLTAAKKWGKPAGMFASDENIEWAIEKGFTLNTVGTADRFLLEGAFREVEGHEDCPGWRNIGYFSFGYHLSSPRDDFYCFTISNTQPQGVPRVYFYLFFTPEDVKSIYLPAHGTGVKVK